MEWVLLFWINIYSQGLSADVYGEYSTQEECLEAQSKLTEKDPAYFGVCVKQK